MSVQDTNGVQLTIRNFAIVKSMPRLVKFYNHELFDIVDIEMVDEDSSDSDCDDS